MKKIDAPDSGDAPARIKPAGQGLAGGAAMTLPGAEPPPGAGRRGGWQLPVELAATLLNGQEHESGGTVTAALTVIDLTAGGCGEISLAVMDHDRRLIYESLFSRLAAPAPAQSFGAVTLYHIALRLPLAPGRYALTFGYHPLNSDIETSSVYCTLPLRVCVPEHLPRFLGIVNLAPTVTAGQPDEQTLARAAARLKELSGQVPDAIDFNLQSHPPILSGFYPLETGVNGHFRWTMGEALCQLRLTGKKLKFRILALHPDARTRPVRIELTAAGVPLPELVLRGAGNAFTEVPHEVLDRVVPLRLKVHGAWRPDECFKGNPDRRVLGIALAGIESVA